MDRYKRWSRFKHDDSSHIHVDDKTDIGAKRDRSIIIIIIIITHLIMEKEKEKN